MNYFAPFIFVLTTLSVTATPAIVSYSDSSTEAFQGSDRTITWRVWKKVPGAEFRVLAGDR